MEIPNLVMRFRNSEKCRKRDWKKFLIRAAPKGHENFYHLELFVVMWQ